VRVLGSWKTPMHLEYQPLDLQSDSMLDRGRTVLGTAPALPQAPLPPRVRTPHWHLEARRRDQVSWCGTEKALLKVEAERSAISRQVEAPRFERLPRRSCSSTMCVSLCSLRMNMNKAVHFFFSGWGFGISSHHSMQLSFFSWPSFGDFLFLMFGSFAQFLFVLYVTFAQFLWLDFPHFLQGRRKGRRRRLRILLLKVPDFTAVREKFLAP
jgi:hypothetical protein